MKVYDPVGSGKASGKAKGGVFSFNRGLATFKKYVIPVVQNTALQLVRKNRFSYLQKYWEKNLTFEQCELWRAWPLPWTDIYGHEVILTGINKFFKCNEILNEASKPLTDTPPTATPSEISAVDNSDITLLQVFVNGISNAEITAQSPFIRIEILGDLQSIIYTTGLLVIKATGDSVSRIPLEKNYTAVYWYDCRAGLEGVPELEIQLDYTDTPPTLQCIRLQRCNKYGYWSGLYTYLHPVSVINLANNGRFNTDTAWMKDGAWAINGGRAWNTGSGSLNQQYTQMQVGKNYKLDFDAYWTSGTTVCNVILSNSPAVGTFNTSGHKSYTKNNVSSRSIDFVVNPGSVFSIDNVVITEI